MRTTRYHCDGPACNALADGEKPPKVWLSASITYENLRHEKATKDVHYCQDCRDKFRKFIKGEADA